MELTLEQQVDRLYDIQQIRNLLGRYQYLLTAHEHQKVFEMFTKREDAYMDCEGMGLLDGQAGIHKFFIDWHKHQDGDSKGQFNVKTITTDIIQVADDGLTAFACWKGPGYETRKLIAGGSDALHLWGTPVMDLIKENGEWKIWHIRLPHTILCNFNRSWIELEGGAAMGADKQLAQNSGKPKGDRPSGFVPSFYGTDRVSKLTFELPVPYDTWDDMREKDFWSIKTCEREL